MHLNHLHIKVRDVPQSRKFYESYLGFRFFKAIDENFIFVRDDYGLLLTLDKGNPEDLVALPKWFHYGFCLSSPDDVKREYERMKSDGIPIGMELKTFEDRVVFMCADPDGYKIEIFWEPVTFGRV